MGSYKDRIEAEQCNMTLGMIRARKNARCHQRNLDRKAQWRAEAEARKAASGGRREQFSRQRGGL